MEVTRRSSKPSSSPDLLTASPWIFDLLTGRHRSSRSVFVVDGDDANIANQIYPRHPVFSAEFDAEELDAKLPTSASSSVGRCFPKQTGAVVTLRSRSTPPSRFPALA
ncbi:hypothetical protein L484_016961 [Morus notabilis]|uniref:Uncharacterized protein n=1 Tax=Morus notabilis TaxID=981085 RepID=W9R1Q8_9ROSA|nr:hypothetical protein L484_016961 [Morus notabilis]